MDKIPTEEELKSCINKYVGYAEQEIYDIIERLYCNIQTEKIEFAKLHLKAQQKAILNKLKAKKSTNGITGLISREDAKQSILNAYPLENIK